MAILKSLVVDDTGNLTLPAGLPAARPTNNISIASFTTVGNTTWTCPAGVTSIEVLVVAGGGGGGWSQSGYGQGGGGAGGVIYIENYSVTPATVYTVTVGTGGAGGTYPAGAAPTAGGLSRFNDIVASGGGVGAYGDGTAAYTNAGTGGSGGGGSAGPGNNTPGYPNTMLTGTPGNGTVGQGNRGGYGGNSQYAAGYKGGGGGGAGEKGQDFWETDPFTMPKGGDGLPYDISGSWVYYGGGGGGGAIWSSWTYAMTGGRGGLGGGGIGGGIGGAGVSGSQIAGTAGAANTGGGGGAGAYQNSGYAGGSGIVILRYSLTSASVNSEAQLRFQSGNRAMEKYVGGKWNTNYANSGIITEGLMCYVDAAKHNGSSTWHDLSGKNNHFTVVGGLTWNESDGSFTSTASTSAYIQNSSFPHPTTQMSQELWVLADTNTGGDWLISYATSSADNTSLFGNTTGITGYVNGTGFGGVGDITGKGWTHLARTSNRVTGAEKIYINGNLVWTGVISAGTSYFGPTGSLILGQEQDSVGGNLDANQALEGRYAIFRCYEKVLTDEEIRNNFNAEAGRFNRALVYNTSHQSASVPIVTSGLVLHYDMGNRSSYPGYGHRIYDLSNNRLHGALTFDAANAVGGPTYFPDEGGGALYFESIASGARSCFITIPSTTLLTGTDPFTVEVWFNNTNDNSGVLIGNYGPSYSSGTFWFYSGGWWINGGTHYHGGTKSGKHCVVATRHRSGEGSTYLDNVELVRSVSNTVSISNSQEFRIGADVNAVSAEQFTGYIYAVKVYNRVLNFEEISQNYHALKPRIIGS